MFLASYIICMLYEFSMLIDLLRYPIKFIGCSYILRCNIKYLQLQIVADSLVSKFSD